MRCNHYFVVSLERDKISGWPVSLEDMSLDTKLLIAKDYEEVICDEDISRVGKTHRNPALTRLTLHAYARNICT